MLGVNVEYSIIDNFLDEVSFKELQNILMGSDIPWYYSKKTMIDKEIKKQDIHEDYNFHFTHSFYADGLPTTNYWPILNNFNNKLNAFSYSKIKVNLTTKTKKIITYGYHTDYIKYPVGLKTAVYYINTNNGKTIFKDGDEVESVENRLLLFDTGMIHTGTSCTDQDRRVLMNINFFPNNVN